MLPSKPSLQSGRLIILGFGGIGNHLMLIPTIRSLKQSNPQLKINLVVPSKICSEIFEPDPDIEKILIINIKKKDGFFYYFYVGRLLKALKPDAVMAAAGTDPVVGSLLSFLSGASQRIGEDWRGRAFLYTHKLKANQSDSELEQNIRLANFLSVTNGPHTLQFYLSKDETDDAQRWLMKMDIPPGATLLGIHPGCGKQQEWKRWEIEKFIAVAKEMANKDNVWIIFFFGPDENDLISSVQNADILSAVICKDTGSIRKTAAIIGCCSLFLSNDSGLRHIAFSLGVSSVGIFGPTSQAKNYINEENHKALSLKNIACSPCHYTRWFLACEEVQPCLKNLSAKHVISSLSELLNKN
ncbi:MAG: glycosyltransferase family 9 protein [Thermodesulfobacteriota bacterium]|nr:glycosyltransferase family 9 protein [Thermodesulfobacteriota bacterium]